MRKTGLKQAIMPLQAQEDSSAPTDSYYWTLDKQKLDATCLEEEDAHELDFSPQASLSTPRRGKKTSTWMSDDGPQASQSTPRRQAKRVGTWGGVLSLKNPGGSRSGPGGKRSPNQECLSPKGSRSPGGGRSGPGGSRSPTQECLSPKGSASPIGSIEAWDTQGRRSPNQECFTPGTPCEAWLTQDRRSQNQELCFGPRGSSSRQGTRSPNQEGLSSGSRTPRRMTMGQVAVSLEGSSSLAGSLPVSQEVSSSRGPRTMRALVRKSEDVVVGDVTESPKLPELNFGFRRSVP